MKFQNVLEDPDENILHVFFIMEHRTVLIEQRKVLCQLLVCIEEYVEGSRPVTCRLEMVSPSTKSFDDDNHQGQQIDRNSSK